MKKRILTTTLILFALVFNSSAQMERYSSNPIPKLNVFGVALSENVESANKMFN